MATYPILTPEVKLQNIIKENYNLNFKEIQVSISDLEDGILDKYDTSILIIVGHGTPDGLSDNIEEMDWEDVNELITNENAQLTFVASCYGENAIQNLKNGFGFPGEVDSQFAAYFVLSSLFRAMNENSICDEYFSLALNRLYVVLSNPEYSKNLRAFAYENLSSDYELPFHMIVFLLFIVNFFVFGAPIFEDGGLLLAITVGFFNLPLLILSFALFFSGDMTIVSFVGVVLGFLSSLLGSLPDFIDSIADVYNWNWLSIAFYTAIVVANIALYTNPASGTVKIIATIASGAAMLALLVIDGTDYNDWVG